MLSESNLVKTTFNNSIISNDDDEKRRDQFVKEITFLPSKLNAVLLEVRQLRQSNLFLTQEYNELCNDIQDMIDENRELISDNERLTKCVYSQQQRIQQLEE